MHEATYISIFYMIFIYDFFQTKTVKIYSAMSWLYLPFVVSLCSCAVFHNNALCMWTIKLAKIPTYQGDWCKVSWGATQVSFNHLCIWTMIFWLRIILKWKTEFFSQLMYIIQGNQLYFTYFRHMFAYMTFWRIIYSDMKKLKPSIIYRPIQ